MKKDAAEAAKAMMDRSVEAPVRPDQREVETKLLATLATVINSDQANLKYDILEMDASDFHFRDHREIFAAIKALADAGDHIDQAMVRAKVGDAWTDALKAVFYASNANAGAADTYKRRVIFWSDII